MTINAMITEDDLISRTILCDLLFLDIELPDGKGLDILQSIQNVDFTVIITTSFEKYAEEFGSPNIIYSLLKPLTHESLEIAMNRYSEKK